MADCRLLQYVVRLNDVAERDLVLCVDEHPIVANVVLPKTKGHNGGLVAIVLGWTMAVFIGVYVSSKISGGHLNPMVTIALANAGKFDWNLVPAYILAQLLGAMLGAFFVTYWNPMCGPFFAPIDLQRHCK